MNSRFVTFIDPSPMEDKKYIKQLMREMIPLKKMWGGLATVKIAKGIKMMVIDAETGEKADFGSKKTIIESYKKEKIENQI